MMMMKKFDDANIKMILSLFGAKVFAQYILSVIAMKTPKGKGKLVFKIMQGLEKYNFNDMTKDYKDFDAILLTSWDHVFKPDILERLWNANKPIVSAMFRSRTKDGNPYLLCDILPDGKNVRYVEPKSETELFTVDSTGLGFMLVRREVFDKLEKPFFRTGETLNENIDRDFCKRAKEAGFEIWVDPHTKIGHWISEMKW